MKLVRYGDKGQEKPGLIDKSGQLRDLSGHMKDLDGEAYSPASLDKLAALDPAKFPAVSGKPRFGAPRYRHLEIRRDRTELHRPCQGNRKSDSGRADFLPQGQYLTVRPQRSGGEAARLDQARLGSRNRRHHRHPRQICLGSRRAQSCGWLLRLQRRVRAQFPDRAAGSMDQGQVPRHVRPGRPVARHQGRDSGRPKIVDVARRQRQAPPDRHRPRP